MPPNRLFTFWSEEKMAHKYTPLVPGEPASYSPTTEKRKNPRILSICLYMALTVSLITNLMFAFDRQSYRASIPSTMKTASPVSVSSSWEVIWGNVPTISLTWESWSAYSKPGEDVTHLWHQLSRPGMGLLRIPQARRSGLPHSFVADDGAEDSAEIYMTSAAHQLHCLTMLRSYVSNNYESSSKESDLTKRKEASHAPEIHLFHCLDYVRQAIMCTGDTTLEPVDYVRGENGLSDGFEIDASATPRVCKNWDVMRGVMDDFAIPFRSDPGDDGSLG